MPDTGVGVVYFFAPWCAVCNASAHQLRWFDRWLKGEGSLADVPKVQYYAMGANEWRAAERWPPPSARPLTLHLDSDGGANSLFGDGRLGGRDEDREHHDGHQKLLSPASEAHDSSSPPGRGRRRDPIAGCARASGPHPARGSRG